MPLVLSRSSNPVAELGLLVVLWVVSVAVVYWDLRRRWLTRSQTRLWLALVGLLPGVGLAIYLVSRLFGWLFPLSANGQPPATAKHRVTQFQRAPAAGAVRTGTILGADLVKETIAERPAARPKPVTLSVIAGPHAGQEFPVDALPARLGRGAEAALRLDRDLGISRQHAELYRQDGILRIRDLGSSHGLSVNGIAIHDQALAPGDKIELGLSTLVLKEAGA
jgi:hypothetical protein